MPKNIVNTSIVQSGERRWALVYLFQDVQELLWLKSFGVERNILEFL